MQNLAAEYGLPAKSKSKLSFSSAPEGSGR
jgi:hypothetical protein